jgi:hypothetical protein
VKANFHKTIRRVLPALAVLALFVWGWSGANLSFNDSFELRGAAGALIGGHASYPYYGDGVPLGYAPPYVPLFIPLACLPWAWAVALVVAVAAVSAVLLLRRWANSARLPWWLVAVLFSLPVYSLVSDVEFSPVLGFAALSLAIWSAARKQWWLCGAMLALGLLRTTNAIPVVTALAGANITRPKDLFKICAGLSGVLLPLVAIATLWDRGWVGHYLTNLSQLSVPGLPHLIDLAWGRQYVWVLLAAVAALGAFIGIRNRDGFNEDHGSVALGISVWCTSTPLAYAGVFALPAVIRTALRQRVGEAAWVAAAMGWIALFLFSSVLVNDVVTLLLPLLAWPLLLQSVRSHGE